MKYLEVKFEKENEENIDSLNFISNVIESQKYLGIKEQKYFENEKLLSLGFLYNPSTKGYAIERDFTLEEIEKLAREVDKIKNHILTYSYITLKIYKDKLYFWDRALTYEGLDTFEYCLKYHNKFTLGKVNIVTKSNSINEELLNLANYTKRYSEPSLEFITQGCVWDKKEGLKILKAFVKDINEYIPIDKVTAY